MPFLDGSDTGGSGAVSFIPTLEGSKPSHGSKKDLDEDSQEWLTVSPYIERPHLLNLSTAERAQGLLARALTLMTPIREDYATAAYSESFNWSEVILALRALVHATNVHWEARSFFIIVFRSQVKPQTDRSHLGDLDQRSHAEAMSSGGLLKYWFGVPDDNYRNLATCES